MNPRIAIVANNASTNFGGESFIPFHFFKRLHERGLPVKLLVHERCREDLEMNLSPSQFDQVIFFKDTALQRVLHHTTSFFPKRIVEFTTQWWIALLTEAAQKKVLKNLVQRGKIDIIHQCSSVSPRLPSLLYNFPVPCVIGPLNGNMEYPPGLRLGGSFETYFVKLLRLFSKGLNSVMPGKLQADVLIVANVRTLDALPQKSKGSVVMMIENGVDLKIWDFNKIIKKNKEINNEDQSQVVKYVYCGAFVDFKAVDLLLYAFKEMSKKEKAHLTLIGDGYLREHLKMLIQELDLSSSVKLTGSLTQDQIVEMYRESDVFVFPSLRDCGGAVVLEAMAMELPVIAAKWGGPEDYVTSECGILVEPTSKEEYINGLAEAMIYLAKSPKLRKKMGIAGRKRIIEHFDWDKKISRLIEIYQNTIRKDQGHG